MKSLFENEKSKELFIKALNVILDREDDPIIKVKELNLFHSQKQESRSILVLDAQSSKGEWIEMELLFGEPKFYRTWLRKCTNHHIKTALQNRASNDSHPYVSVAFINGVLFPDTESIHMKLQYRETTLGIPLSEHMEYHVIELGKIMTEKNISGMLEIEELIAVLIESNEKETGLNG